MEVSLDLLVRRIVRAGAAAPVAVALLSTPAFAQTPADDTSALEEVVVTAQFREQRLQDTPIALTAVSAEMLENRSQNSLAAVTAQAPNVVLRETGGAFGPGMSASIRGVGQGDFNPAFEPGVGIYIDDVYYSSLTGANFDLLDLDRVEIARGPQGVLGGRNSVGGSIKLFSAKPQGDGSGSVRGTFGTRNLLDVRAVGDFALVEDTLMMRMSGVTRRQDGYVTRLDYSCVTGNTRIPNQAPQGDCVLGKQGGRTYSAGRAALRWLASEAIEVNLAADMTVDSSEQAAIVLQNARSPAEQAAINPAATGSLFSTTYGEQYGRRFVPADPRISYASFNALRPQNLFGPPNPLAGSTISADPDTDTKIWGTNLTVDWTLAEKLVLKSVTAYREFDSRWSNDNDVSPLTGSLGIDHLTNNSFSQELRLNGVIGDAVDYTLGAYYFDQTTTYATHQILPFAVPGFEFLGDDPVDASSYAGFANASWHLTDALNLNAGVRWTKEEKDYRYSRNGVGGSLVLGLDALNNTVGRYEGNQTDYRLNLDYRWNDMVMTYASVSTGFKGGGTNARPFGPGQVVPFDKETLQAFELGAKTDFFDRRLRVNVSAFLNKYEDIQITLLECPTLTPVAPCAATFNAGNADIKGWEIELEAHPIENLTIDATFSDLNFEYTSLLTSASGANITGLTLGQAAPGTVETKWSLGLQYDLRLAGGARISPRFDYSFQGGFNTNAVFAPSNRVAGFHLGDVRLTYAAADDSWEASLVGRNVFDERYFISNFDLLASSGAQYGLLGQPREMSIVFKKKF